jgi:hypothetical protein
MNWVPRGTGKHQDKHEEIVDYYESRKRELKIRLMDEGRCDESLKTRVEESTSHIHWVTRHDGSTPTDTQADTQIRSPRQDDDDHCLVSRRRHLSCLL